MNRIVRENYPVEKLPDDLRDAFAGQDAVKLTIETQPAQKPHANVMHSGAFSRFRHLAEPHYKTFEEINAYVNGLRDEWDDRDRLLHPET